MSDLSELKRLAEAATPQNFDSAEEKSGNGHIECPHCNGQGEVELEADYLNYDSAAIGVQFYGIGNEFGAAEAYYRAANPAAVLALIAEVEQLQYQADSRRKLHARECVAMSEVQGDLITERDKLKAEVERQAAEIAELKGGRDGLKWVIGQHKNLHRSLCARFGYVHDDRDWWRDDVSLEEHIAKQLQEALAGQMHLTCERDLLKAENETLRTGMKGDYDLDAWLDWTKEKGRLKAEVAARARQSETLTDWYAHALNDAESLRSALCGVMEQVEGNIRATIRDCVNGMDAVQDIYEYCDNIEAMVDLALSKGERV